MREKTPEQRTADNALEDAIQKVIKVYELMPEDALLIDFLVILEGVDMNDETSAHYAQLMRNGNMRTTVALGMCDMTRSYLLGDMRAVDE